MKIIIIGAGNIATHYAKSFHSLRHEIFQIYNRTSANALALADAVSATPVHDIYNLDLNADLYIIAIADNHIQDIVDKLSNTVNGIVIHTSGATPLSILSKFERYGVIYPPQSLNKNIDSNLNEIPFGVEGSDKNVETELLSLTLQISPKAFRCNSQQRLALHIAAVFANNFSNALFSIAYSILEKEDLQFDLIKPIILETAEKVQSNLPQTVQTGPAVRNDLNTINTHLEFLSYSNNLSEIYQTITNFIIKSKLK